MSSFLFRWITRFVAGPPYCLPFSSFLLTKSLFCSDKWNGGSGRTFDFRARRLLSQPQRLNSCWSDLVMTDHSLSPVGWCRAKPGMLFCWVMYEGNSAGCLLCFVVWVGKPSVCVCVCFEAFYFQMKTLVRWKLLDAPFQYGTNVCSSSYFVTMRRCY